MGKYNDIDMKNWKEYTDIYTDAIYKHKEKKIGRYKRCAQGSL